MAFENEADSGCVMFGTQAKIKATPKPVNKAAEKGAYTSFMHAARSIRKSAIDSITRSNKPSAPGGPVHTRRGRGGGLAKRSILYGANKEGAVIGFASSRIGTAMEAHEHAKRRGGVRFKKRPTMQLALQRNLARFHREWRWA